TNTINPTPAALESLIMKRSPPGFSARDGDLHETIRPAALRVPGARNAGRIVRANTKQVFARLAERRRRRRKSVGVHLRGRLSERDAPGALTLDPREGGRNVAAPNTGNSSDGFAVVFRPHVHGQRLADRRLQRPAGDSARPGAFGTRGIETQRRWCIAGARF